MLYCPHLLVILHICLFYTLVQNVAISGSVSQETHEKSNKMFPLPLPLSSAEDKINGEGQGGGKGRR